MKKESYKKIAAVSIFAIAMAFLESVVVVYLRKIYYPEGFGFPLKGFIDSNILNIEWVREFFTIVMLLAIGYLAGRKYYEKFAYFLYAFAIWDVFYYVWLKLILNWPPSFLTWDLLFLIPLPWVSPVLAPIIYSIDIAILAILIVHFTDKNKKVFLNVKEWLIFIAASGFILYTFLYDYARLILEAGFFKNFFNLASNLQFISGVSSYIPKSFNWPVFLFGEFLIILAITLFCLRNKK